MQRSSFVAVSVLMVSIAAAAADDFRPETIIALERAALDRWGKGDPQGFLEIYAPDITYFDPGAQTRLDGLAAMKKLLVPFTGKIKIDSYEMLGPRVQRHGEVAILTYNLVNHRNMEPRLVRWNSTAVYARYGATWKMIHSHWSYTKPELRQAGGQ